MAPAPSIERVRRQERSERAGLRIGLVVGGDAEDAAAWSGVPAGVLGGLREAGVEVVPVRAALPPRLVNETLAAIVESEAEVAATAQLPFGASIIAAARRR